MFLHSGHILIFFVLSSHNFLLDIPTDICIFLSRIVSAFGANWLIAISKSLSIESLIIFLVLVGNPNIGNKPAFARSSLKLSSNSSFDFLTSSSILFIKLFFI